MIVAEFNLQTKKWSIGDNYDNQLALSLVDESSESIKPLNINFGAVATVKDNTVLSVKYPPQNVVYKEVRSGSLFKSRINAQADDVVELLVFIEIEGARFSDLKVFTVPRPANPYGSWIWEDGAWASPVKYPSDGKLYVWDEAKINWIELEI